MADGRRVVRSGDCVCRRRHRQRDWDVRGSSSVHSKGGGGGFLDFALVEVPFGCGKVPIRHVRKNEAGDTVPESRFRLDGPTCCAGRSGHLQGGTRHNGHGQTALSTHSLWGATGVQQTVVLWTGAELRRSFRRVTIMSLLVAVVGFTLLAILHRLIIRLVLGEGFAEASSPLLIMIPGAFVASTAVYSVLPVSTGRNWPVLVSGTGAILASVFVLVWMVPQYGAEGAAWARTTYSLVSALILVPFIVPILRQSYGTPGG